MEGPGSNGLLGHLVGVCPSLARANLVRAATVVALSAERPRSVRIDPIAKAVDVEAMRCCACILHVDPQPIARARIYDGARAAAAERRLIDVVCNNLVWLRDQVL